MGIYNCAATLQEAVSSIQEQSFDDWELILCDDGSDDKTYETAIALAENDDRIQVLRNKVNMGLAHTLNNCLKQAKGDYIARMDGDDRCPRCRFQLELEILEKDNSYAFVSGWMECYDENGTYGIIKYRERPTFNDLARSSQFCHAGVLIKKDVLLSVGGYREDLSVLRVEDYDLWVRLYAEGYQGYNLQQVVYQMRDDRNAFHRRKMRYRINEARVSYHAYKHSTLSVVGMLYPITILMKSCIPSWAYSFLHKYKVGKSC